MVGTQSNDIHATMVLTGFSSIRITNKLPYQKLQYPTYVKDTNSDAHIRIFKKVIKANGETMEVDIINMFGFTL